MEISLQNWVRRKRVDAQLFQNFGRRKQKLNDLPELFEDVMVSEKCLPIDVCLRKDEFIKQKHLIQTLELLSCVYPEVKKVKKLAKVIMKTVSDQFIPS